MGGVGGHIYFSQQAPCGCDQSMMRSIFSFLFFFLNFYVAKCGGLVATQTISTV